MAAPTNKDGVNTPPLPPLCRVREVTSTLPMASRTSPHQAIRPNMSSENARWPSPTSWPPDSVTMPPTSAPPSHGSSAGGMFSPRIRSSSEKCVRMKKAAINPVMIPSSG